MKKVSEGVKAAVATGENFHDISEFRDILDAGAVDVVQVGAGTSGITVALMIGELAYAFDEPVSVINCPAHFMAHEAAALPNRIMMEAAMLGRSDGLVYNHTIDSHWIMLSDGPSLGIEFDVARICQVAVRRRGGCARRIMGAQAWRWAYRNSV